MAYFLWNVAVISLFTLIFFFIFCFCFEECVALKQLENDILGIHVSSQTYYCQWARENESRLAFYQYELIQTEAIKTLKSK